MTNKKRKDLILLFIPAYNCHKQISRVLSKVSGKILNHISGVIVVENRSNDGTLRAAIRSAKKIKKPVVVLQNKQNYNLGGSHKVAFKYAIQNNFDYLITLHGDDQANIYDLSNILEKGIYRNFSSILGSRFDKKSIVHGYSKYRIYGNHLVNLICSIITGSKITDTGSGLNMYKMSFIKKCPFYTFPDDLTFNVYLLLFTIYSKSKFMFSPITWREDDQISNAKVVKQGIHILGLFFKYLISPKKIFQRKMHNFAKIYSSEVIYEHTINDC